MKVFIQFDFEGIAGFVVRDNRDRNIPTVLNRTKRFMKIATAEVSAAANGAFEAGADEVIIWDSHGQGNTILVEELPEQAQLITGEYGRGPWLPFFEGTDVGMYIGGHAMEGTARAVTPHTLKEVNGRAFGEVGMFINCCGAGHVPVVLVSGDTAVQREVAWQIPDSEFVVTKDAVGPSLAKTITPALSCRFLFEAAERGVQRRGDIQPFRMDPPYKFKHHLKDEYYTDPGDDFLVAYRRYLKRIAGYTRGWPGYNLRDEDYGVD
jgi:D-amino peptidase